MDAASHNQHNTNTGDSVMKEQRENKEVDADSDLDGEESDSVEHHNEAEDEETHAAEDAGEQEEWEEEEDEEQKKEWKGHQLDEKKVVEVRKEKNMVLRRGDHAESTAGSRGNEQQEKQTFKQLLRANA